jgi:hypothetical protein
MTRNRYGKTSNPYPESSKRYGEAGKGLQIASKAAAESSKGILMTAERFWVLFDGNGPPRYSSAIGADDCRRSRRRYPGSCHAKAGSNDVTRPVAEPCCNVA